MIHLFPGAGKNSRELIPVAKLYFLCLDIFILLELGVTAVVTPLLVQCNPLPVLWNALAQ